MSKAPKISFTEKARNYLKASYPLLWIKTHEEQRVIKDILTAFENTTVTVNIYAWDAINDLTKAKRNKDEKGNPVTTWEKVNGDTKIQSVIPFIRKIGGPNERSVVILKDFHSYINVPGTIRHIRNAIEDLRARATMVVFLSPVIQIPVELEKDVQIMDFTLPDEAHLTDTLLSVYNSVKARYTKNPEACPQLSKEVQQATVEAMKGMTHSESHDACSLAIVENQAFNENFVRSVFDEKVKQVKRHGLLQYLKPDATFESIGGLDMLKDWINNRALAYSAEAREYSLPYPKGILLCGLPGCGKTLLAKATANALGFPLFQLDVGGLFGKHVGESEENFRKVVEMVDSIGRCVLFIDEVEKSLNREAVSGTGDTGTSSRSFATLLTWLSEHTSPVFTIATSNDHTRLPAELTRKGRFDELFWIDLPDLSDRKEIFKVLLKRYNRDASKFKIDELATAAEGFTGAEIENVITSSMFARFAIKKDINTTSLIDEMATITPLSKMSAAEIDVMRKKAEGKLRPVTSAGAAKHITTASAGANISLSL